MKIQAATRRVHALTLVEVLIVLATIAVIAFLIRPGGYTHKVNKEEAMRIRCVSNLKQVTLSYKLFATDHNDLYPMQVSTNEGGSLEFNGSTDVFENYRSLSNELYVPRVLVCPEDQGRTVATNFQADFSSNRNISYFVGLNATDTQPGMFLTGDRYIALNGKPLTGIQDLQPVDGLAWWTMGGHSEYGGGNMGLADGSVQSFSSEVLRDNLLNTGSTTNLVAIPE